MVPVLLVAMLLGRWRRLGDHGIQVPIMVLLSLLTVKGTDTQFTYLTIVETVLGGIIGVATNAVVLAPLHIQQPRDAVRSLTARVRRLLNDMSEGLREGWDAELDEMEVLDTFEFTPNQVVLFVKTFNSWHSVRPMTGAGSPLMRKTLTINIEAAA